jgi:hypothetical protein
MIEIGISFIYGLMHLSLRLENGRENSVRRSAAGIKPLHPECDVNPLPTEVWPLGQFDDKRTRGNRLKVEKTSSHHFYLGTLRNYITVIEKLKSHIHILYYC